MRTDVHIHLGDARPGNEERTQRWRTIVRGEERRVGERLREQAERRYNTPGVVARRRAITKPGNFHRLRFSHTGELLNHITEEGELLD